MYPCMREEGNFISPVFTREKIDEYFRKILNIKQIIKHFEFEHLKMEFWIL